MSAFRSCPGLVDTLKMARQIEIIVTPLGGDRVYHISPEDVRVVISRLPNEAYSRLKAVHFNDQNWGGRTLGYTNRDRREIVLCSLPPRMSLTGALAKGQSPEMFGGRRGTQWPKLGIRRFLLYHVLLHEIGHLQIIGEKSNGGYHKWPREGKAQEFAMYWRQRLWSESFDHPDPVHNPPAKNEF